MTAGARLAGLLVASAVLAPSSARAHDFWVEPSTFEPPLGVRFAIVLYVGERLEGDPVARAPDRIERFVMLGRDVVRVRGKRGAHPAGSVRTREPGLHVVVFESDFASIELEAPTFEAYLRAEGLERIAAIRAERGQTDAPGRELYAREAKALVAIGGSARGADRAVGLPLELVAVDNPYELDPGQPLEVRLLHRGAPLEGALVVARAREAPDEPVAVRTDADGRVLLRLNRDGMWLVKAVHMVESPDPARGDWASYWASLTFELGKPPGR